MESKNHLTAGDKPMQLDNKGIAWKSGLFQIVSLLDMLKICAEDFCTFMRELEALSNDDELFDFERPGLTENEVLRIKKVIDNAYMWCNLLELSGASKIAEQIKSKISTYVFLFLPDDFDYPLLELRGYMEMLQKFIKDELGNRLFLYIPDEDHVRWYEKKDGFGIDVSIAFPSAIEDVKEAGNCYANGRYTACVFHLMRIAEIGLRALVWDRRIKFKKDTPIELKELRELFQGLEQAEKAIEGYPKTMARNAQFDFYHGAMAQLRAFKNLYRNRTMHAREFFSQYQAKEVIKSVSTFMKILASKISETKRTPLVWKKV